MSNKFDLIAEYQRIAKVYNLTEQQVKEIYESQFHFSRLAMKEGTHDDADSFKNINFIYLGKLYVKKGVVNKMKERKLKKKMKDEKLLEGFSIDPEKEYKFVSEKINDNLSGVKLFKDSGDNVGEVYIRLGKYLESNEISALQFKYIVDNENNT